MSKIKIRNLAIVKKNCNFAKNNELYMKRYIFLVTLILIIVGCSIGQGKVTVIDVVIVPAASDQWEYMVEGGDKLTLTTDSLGKGQLELEIDTVKRLLLVHPETGFVAETWVMPGEKCEVNVNRITKNIDQQISTNGVFKERTAAAYSQSFGYFYQLLANDNFYVPLDSDENSYTNFIIEKYTEHLDTLNNHPEWPIAVKEEALRTLNNKMWNRIEDPQFWLEFCADLREFKGEVCPTALSEENKNRVYQLIDAHNHP